MKNIKKNQVRNNFRNDFLVFSTYLTVFTFSLAPFLISTSFVVFTTATILNVRKYKINFFYLTLFSCLALIYLFGYVFTSYPSRAQELIIRVLPVLIAPVLIVYSKVYLKINYSCFRASFILGLITSSIISLLLAFTNYFQELNTSVFFYFKLGSYLHIHPIYYSLFLIIGFKFTFNDNLPNYIKINAFYIRILYALMIFLLQSKMAFIVFVIVLFYCVLFKVKRIKRTHFLSLISLSLVFTLLMHFSSNIRVNEIFKDRNEVAIGNFNEDGVSQRVWLWSQAIKQIKESPNLFFGYGLGSQEKFFKNRIEQSLLEENLENTYILSAKRNSTKNLHNQYLQLFYELGLFSLLLFVISIIILIVKAYYKNNKDFIITILIFSIFMLTENFLDRQLGVYFFSIIPIMLFYENNNTKPQM